MNTEGDLIMNKNKDTLSIDERLDEESKSEALKTDSESDEK